MRQRFLVAAALTAALCPCSRVLAAGSELIPETTANRHGLTRPWFTQVELDGSRGRICDIVLEGGILYAQTDTAMLHAIDAETGKTLWAKQIGRPRHPSLTPGANRDLLGIINGSRLYVVNRYNGDLLYETEVNGAPGAGPALSAKRVYVPTVTGLVIAYRLQPLVDPMQELGKVKKDLTPEEKAKLDEERRQNIRLRQEFIPPLSCQSFGRTLVQPLVTRETSSEEYAAWPTDRGFLNIGRINRQAEDMISLKYRLETAAPIVCRPAYLPPDPKVTGDSGLIFVGSRDGFLHAIQEKTGESLWRFSTGEPIAQSPAVIDTRVYVCTQLGGMYCLEAKTGKDLWWSPNIVQFVSASKGRVYAADQIGRILVLNAENGSRLDTIAAENVPIKLSNSDTDRLYLANDKGLIHCLHEVEQVEPLPHGQDRKQAAETEEKPAVAQKKIETGEAKEKPAKKDRVAPKEKKERVAPIPKEKKERPLKKAKAGKKGAGGKAADGGGADQGANPFMQGGGADGGAFGAPAGGKAKGGKAKGNQNQPDGNPFQ